MLILGIPKIIICNATRVSEMCDDFCWKQLSASWFSGQAFLENLIVCRTNGGKYLVQDNLKASCLTKNIPLVIIHLNS